MANLSTMAKLRLLEAVPESSSRMYAEEIFLALGQQDTFDWRSVALAIRCASNARASLLNQQSVTPVWTGPASTVVPVRRTQKVLLELIRDARKRLLIVSFAAYRVDDVLSALSDAASRGVQVSLILESKALSGGLLTRDAREAFKKLPASVQRYEWPLEHREVGGAALHAKAVLMDGAAALITSANLTGSALERNIELGLLVRGGDLPDELQRHFDGLVESGELITARN
jgi:phosphatidylserine/phosphatidylglycerophosphate/cardiolipin synthase-like enzyme